MDFSIPIILVILLIAGFIKGFSGFATSMVLTAGLVFYYTPLYIIPILAMLSVTLNIFLVIEHFKYIKQAKDNFALRPETIIALLAGTFIGAYFLGYLNPNIIKIVLGLFIIVFIYLIRDKIKEHKEYIKSKFWLNIIIGSVSGLFSGFINVNGPPAMLFGLYHKYDKIKLLKAVSVFFLIADALTIIVFYINGFYSLNSLITYIEFIPFIIIGFLVGAYTRRHVDNTTFKKYVVILLLILAVELLINGFGLF